MKETGALSDLVEGGRANPRFIKGDFTASQSTPFPPPFKDINIPNFLKAGGISSNNSEGGKCTPPPSECHSD